MTISSVSAAAPFAAGTPTPALPATLTAGQTLSVPVSFSPTTWGADTGDLALSTDRGRPRVGAERTGTQPGLAADTVIAGLGVRGRGQCETLTVGVTNTSTSTETITGVTGPSAPFSAGGLPAVGDTLAAGASATTSPSPTRRPLSESDSSSIVLTSDQGR